LLLDQKGKNILPELPGYIPNTTKNNINKCGLEYIQFNGSELKEYFESKLK